MSTVRLDQNADANDIRDEWIHRLSDLIGSVATWAGELEWTTRRIETRMNESQLGSYNAPALMLQKGTAKVLLEPIARFANGADGVVDLYLMPSYDDIASIYFYDDTWNLHYMFRGSPVVANPREAESQPLSKESLQKVLNEMIENAA